MIFIPLRNQTSYEELRYCLRAIELHHPDQEVMIAGTLPNWIKNVIHLPFTDAIHHEFKARNIYLKIKEGFRYTDEMLFFNDDHIIQAPVDYLHHKGLMIIENRHQNGTYTALLRNTLRQFPGCYDYDTHCPIHYNKEMFAKLETLDWNKPHGYGIKSSYCALNNLVGTFYPDLKFRHKIGDIEGRLYFSTDDSCDLSKLKEILPNRSKFEK